jgi:triosephosphate isomerase
MRDRSDTRKLFIAGNWKMNDPGAGRYVRDLRTLLSGQGLDPVAREVWVCPPFTALGAAIEAAGGSGVSIAAQNMNEAASGAFTGEVSGPMLTALGVGGVILGHSERRQLYGETDEALAAKVPAALSAGLVPILCIGETAEERKAGETNGKLQRQIESDLAGVDDESLGVVVIAYEPIWAIGSGDVATPEQAQDACAHVRSLIAARSPQAAERIRILYGGSVNAGNASELLAARDIDGALVGGASLDPVEFAKIVAAA